MSPEPAQAQTTGICDRTAQVRTAILGEISSVTACADATATHLAAITSLTITNDSTLTSLQAGDFAGLTGLTDLDLNGNGLTALPADVFDGLTALTTLQIAGNSGLTMLPANVFDDLTALTDLNLDASGLESLPAGRQTSVKGSAGLDPGLKVRLDLLAPILRAAGYVRGRVGDFPVPERSTSRRNIVDERALLFRQLQVSPDSRQTCNSARTGMRRTRRGGAVNAIQPRDAASISAPCYL